ncbi:PTS system cellobiose-specific IIA component [Propionicimonas paludicola]|uniref:PTS system cellobiose-specific IIA component n=1 Tax=Propionicimonas paludicola TaxID=185243 RepID=A0A2A9CUG1_9ACTN|nr:PTS lactose/cellobiose transporter subunit IIA [Propionicimonas paludicola]PFG17771.1 PTS system cellobiose-specific IIA component [Propionicimonas paludicola]
MEDNDELVQASMQVILAAGDGRTHAMRALELAGEGDHEAAQAELDLAEAAITEGHRMQTEVIQGSVRGEARYSSYSMLFSHAQDSLMVVVSEVQITKRMLPILKALHTRIDTLESEHAPR